MLHDGYEELRDEYREFRRDRQRVEDERRQVLRELDRVTSDYLSDIYESSTFFIRSCRLVTGFS